MHHDVVTMTHHLSMEKGNRQHEKPESMVNKFRQKDETYLLVKVLVFLKECVGESSEESIQWLSGTYLERSEDSNG